MIGYNRLEFLFGRSEKERSEEAKQCDLELSDFDLDVPSLLVPQPSYSSGRHSFDAVRNV